MFETLGCGICTLLRLSRYFGREVFLVTVGGSARIDAGIISPNQPYSSAARMMSLAATAPWSMEYQKEK